MAQDNDKKLEQKLFPSGVSFEKNNDLPVVLEQCRIFVDTSEKLVARRQTINTFFFSINTLIISALGLAVSLIGKGAIEIHLIGLGIVVVSMVGILLCVSWRRLVRSYAQLNRAKFDIIHAIERHLPVALFSAEWHVLGEGREPSKYRPFTNIEKGVPLI